MNLIIIIKNKISFGSFFGPCSTLTVALSQLAANIDHFAMYGSVGMALTLTNIQAKVMDQSQQHLKVIQWIKAQADKPEKSLPRFG